MWQAQHQRMPVDSQEALLPVSAPRMTLNI
jgi:hypothetical protein